MLLVRSLKRLAFPLLGLAGFSAGLAAQAHADGLYVAVDEASIVKLDAPASDVIIGNPSFAAVTVHSGDTLVITGKTYGQTNIIVLDARGREILNDQLTVVGTRRTVTVNRGGARYSYLCAPVCRTAPQIGDEATYYEAITKQVQAKNGLAEGSAGAAGAQ